MTAADRWFERDGARLRWRQQGDGPALLLLHGWALDLELFEPLVAAVGGALRILRFDRRGYGLSSGEPALETDVADAFALLDAAGIGRCAVLGMSQGARVAAALARRAPQRVTHAILDGAPGLRGLADQEHEPELPLEELRALALAEPAALRARLASHPLLRLVRPTPATATLLADILARYGGADLRTTAPPPQPSPEVARLPAAFGQPVLVLNGAQDSAARLRIGRRLASVLPRARRVVLEDAGHLACLDDPATYAASVLAFLSTD